MMSSWAKTQELLTGVVTRIDPRNGALHVKIGTGREFTEALLAPPVSRCAGRATEKATASRCMWWKSAAPPAVPRWSFPAPTMAWCSRLFEMEVPEIYDGVVEITLHRPRSRQPYQDGRLVQ